MIDFLAGVFGVFVITAAFALPIVAFIYCIETEKGPRHLIKALGNRLAPLTYNEGQRKAYNALVAEDDAKKNKDYLSDLRCAYNAMIPNERGFYLAFDEQKKLFDLMMIHRERNGLTADECVRVMRGSGRYNRQVDRALHYVDYLEENNDEK